MPDFKFQSNFPIASVIDAAGRNAQLQQQAREAGNKSLIEGLQSIGQVGQSLYDTKKRVAQSLALGRQFDVPDDVAKTMTPEQLISVGTIKKGSVDMNMLLNLLHPGSGSTTPVVPASVTPAPGVTSNLVPNGSGGAYTQGGNADPNAIKPGASLPIPKPEAILASASPNIPMPAHTEPAATMPFGGASTPTAPSPSPVPVPIAAPPVRPPTVNSGTLNAAIKLGAFSKPENVFQYTPGKGLQKVGEKGKGDQVITSQPGDKESNEQDKLEQNALTRVATVRGDPSIARIEAQRDAASIAFNTIQKAKNEGREITQTEYYDTLGQLWKARTGSAPTDQSIKDLDINTIQGALHKKLTWVDGKPRGATSQEVVNALQRFIDDSGNQADKLHDGYMKPRLIKPFGLSNERWKAIQESGRGLTYEEATKEVRQAPSGVRTTPNGVQYTVH